MKLAVFYSRALFGIKAHLVTVEAHISPGLPGFAIVGLPETVVKESKDRVRSAIINSGYEFPNRKIIINLAPADLPKEGCNFDLPIALSILAATNQINSKGYESYEFVGELALSGELRPIKGVLSCALEMLSSKRILVVPQGNGDEAALLDAQVVYAANNLRAVCEHLNGTKKLEQYVKAYREQQENKELDLSDIIGQDSAKRALTIAAAGSHSMLMVGPPGSGKTMLAMRMTSIMGALSDQEALEVAAIYSMIGQFEKQVKWRERPFRAPHHTASPVALVGGGSNPRPGEITLAHHGVLFLDELPEFDRKVLEVLREPLEAHNITIARASGSVEFPAQFQLIAAMNPCPCGYLGSNKPCSCRATEISKYRAKISGPLMDRIDMHLTVPAVPAQLLIERATEVKETSGAVKEKVQQATKLQLARQGKPNARLSSRELKKHVVLCKASKQLLAKAVEKFNLSTRSYSRILKVARTIADLAESVDVSALHISEALMFRIADQG